MSWDVPVTPEDIEKHRQIWANVAKKNGWYKQPFFVQVWATTKGDITDSVSFKGLEHDTVLQDGECEQCISCDQLIDLDDDAWVSEGDTYYHLECY